jgi:Cys-rich protein (TIGR01571 family)
MTNHWEHGIFDCFGDVKVCLLSGFCNLWQVAQQKATVEEHDCGIGDVMAVWCCHLCCLVIVRGKIREKYGIEGSTISDFLSICFCAVCAITQQTRQLEAKGNKPAGICMDK